ncbi:MAG: ATP-binding protein [Gammaproteobacteria bacterium]
MPTTPLIKRVHLALNTGNFEQDYRAWVIAGVTAIFIVFSLLLILPDLSSGHFLVAACVSVCPAAMLFSLWRLVIYKDLHTAALAAVLPLFLANALVLILSGGEATGPYVFQPIILLTAIILLRRRISLAVAAGSILLPVLGYYLTTTTLSFPILINDARAQWGLMRVSAFTSIICFGSMYLYNKSSYLMRTRLLKSQKMTERANTDIRKILGKQVATAKLLSKFQDIGKLRGWWYDPETELVHHTFGTKNTTDEYHIGSPIVESSANTTIRPAVRRMIAELMKPGESWDKEVHIPKSDGSLRWLHAIGEVERDGAEIKRIYAVVQDITESKKAQARNAQSQKMESIGTLAAGIAHEINTPIQFVSDNITFLNESFGELQRGIDAIVNRIEEDTDEDPAKLKADVHRQFSEADIEYFFEELPRALAESTEGLNRIKTIVQAMKNFAHPGGSKKSMVNLNEAIRSTLIVCANRCKYSADVVTHYDPQLPLTECMPDEINQAILNIVVNAADSIQEKIDAGLTERGEISVSTYVDNGYIEIRISDTGMGVPEEIRQRVFEPFFTTKDVGMGTGQGLAITYDVVANHHNGELICESEPGQGATFRIRLPIVLKSTGENEEVVAA